MLAKIRQILTTNNILLAMIFLIFVASLLRLYKLGERSLWYDEAASVRNVMGLLKLSPYEDWGLLGLLKEERVPPLYVFFMIPFYYVSSSEWSMRLVSVIFGVATIPLMYFFGSRLFNKKIGFIGALLLTVSPLHIYYSQELRSYSLFLFFSILIFYFSYLALEDNKNTYYIGLTIATVLGVYTYTYAVFPWFIVNLYFIFNWKAYQHLLRKWLLSNLITIILCLPGVFHVIYHLITGTSTLANFPIGLRTIIATPYIFTTGRVFFPTGLNLIFIGIQAVIFGIGLFMGIWALWQERVRQDGRQRLSLFVVIAITCILIWFISLSLVPLFDEGRVNYIIFFLPFYYLLVAKGWNYLPNRTIKAALVGLAVSISLISVYPFYFEWNQVGKGSFRVAAEHVQRNFKEQDAIYHTSGQSTLPFAYYFDWQVPQIPIRKADPNDAHADRLWLIVRESRGGLQFSLSPLQAEQTKNQVLQNDAAKLCNRYVTNEKFYLVDIQTFPGKNSLIVCLYQGRST